MAIGFVGQLGGAGGSAGAAAAIDYGIPVQDLTALRAVPPALRGDKQQRLVEDENAEYRFDATGVGADDGDLIIAPDTGTGRWFKITPSGGIPAAHDLGGAQHNADTFANLDSKVSDGALVVTVEPGTDNLQAAHDALPAGGGSILLKQGTYVIGTAVAISKPNVSIIGIGKATKLDVTGGTGAFDATDAADRLLIADMKIDLNFAAGGLFGIRMDDRNRRTIRHVDFENVLGANTSFIVNTSPGFNPQDNLDRYLHVSGVVTAGSIAIGLDVQTNRTEIIDCELDGCTTGIKLAARSFTTGCLLVDGTTGIEVATSFVKIFGCEFLRMATVGILATAGQNGVVSTCIFDNCPTGIQLDSQSAVSGCVFQDCTVRGILVVDQDSTIGSCSFTSCEIGVEITGASASVTSVSGCNFILNNLATGRAVKISKAFATVSGCIIEGNGSALGQIGIEIIAGGESANIDGCNFRNWTGAAGVGVSVAGSEEDVTISDCIFDGIQDGVVFASACNNGKVSGCHFKSLAGDGVTLASVSGCIVEGNQLHSVTGTEILETGTSNNNLIEGNILPSGTVTLLGATSVEQGTLT